jgi:hypothetical protein
MATLASRKRGLFMLFVYMAAFLCILTDEAQSASDQLRRTVGRLRYYDCSSKDCVVEIMPKIAPPMEFIMYGDFDVKYFNASFRKPDSYMGRKVEVISYKNRHRGDLELVKKIRFAE